MQRRTYLLSAVSFAAAALVAATAWGAPLPVKPAGVDPNAFQPAEACPCHEQLVSDWKQSMHAQALEDPLYRTKVDEANAATDGKIGEFCDTCHGPAATMTGEIAAGGALSAGTGQAVGCSFCHQITGLAEGDIGNVSQLVEPDGTRRAQIKDPQAPHPAAYSEFHTKAELCGGCHNVNHPVNGMHLEATYTEWKASEYAAKGVVCQDCHMSEGAGVVGPSTGVAGAGGPERDNIYRMSFVGAQVALGNAEAATAMLQSAAEVKIDAPDVVAPGEEASATVTVTNVGAGHYLPTGLTEVRQMWLEVAFKDAGGSTNLVERRFGTVLQDDEGNFPVELWEATKIKSDDRIPPNESVSESITVAMPEAAEKGTIVATLYYQSVTDEFARKAGVTNPTTTMASASRDVFGSEEAMAAVDEQAEPEAPATPVMAYAIVAIVVAAAGVGGFLFFRSRKAA